MLLAIYIFHFVTDLINKPDHDNGLFITYCTNALLVSTVYAVYTILVTTYSITKCAHTSHSKQNSMHKVEFIRLSIWSLKGAWPCTQFADRVILTWAVAYVQYYIIISESSFINDTYLVINVCRSGLMSRRIFLIWGSKPISSILSASSRTYIQCAGKGQWDYG